MRNVVIPSVSKVVCNMYVLCAMCYVLCNMRDVCIFVVLAWFLKVCLEAWDVLKVPLFRIVVISCVLDVFCYVPCTMCYALGVVQYQKCV